MGRNIVVLSGKTIALPLKLFLLFTGMMFIFLQLLQFLNLLYVSRNEISGMMMKESFLFLVLI